MAALFVIVGLLGEWALSMVEVEKGRKFRFRGDLYSQESTFPLVAVRPTTYNTGLKVLFFIAEQPGQLLVGL